MNTVIDLRKSQGDYGGSMQALSQIFQYLGQVEADRKERELTDTVLSGLSAGKDFNGILADVSERLESPSFAGGARGLLQRTAGAFGPRQSQTGEILSKMGLNYTEQRKQAEEAMARDKQAQDASLERAKAEAAARADRDAARDNAAQAASDRANEALQQKQAGQMEAAKGLAEQRQAHAELTKEQAQTERRKREALYPQGGGTEAETLPPETPNPASIEDFEDKVAKLKQVDMDSARAFYDKWVGKFRGNR